MKRECLMETILRGKRMQSGLTLRELAKALGEGFSPARVSLAERGLISLPAHDKTAILETIERLAPLHQHRRRIAAIARDIDFAPFVADVREARCAQAQV
jgi:transcriptional regulator with XRE-family HTH domain